MIDWIQGNKFQSMANFTYSPPNKAPCDYAMFPNTLDMGLLKDGDIIYTQGFHHYKRQLLEVIRDSKKVILISHNCDNDVNSSFALPPNVIRWYAQNVNVDDPRIEPLPIGVENDIRDFGVMKKEKMLIKLQGTRNIRNILYIDYNIDLNPAERLKPYQLFEGKPWVSTVRNKSVLFDAYIDNVYNHKFVICPRGNGLTTHRLWEALYMGSIPIKKRHVSNKSLIGLPILFVNDWEEITESFLNDEYERIKNSSWNIEMLTFEYWRNKILNDKGE